MLLQLSVVQLSKKERNIKLSIAIIFPLVRWDWKWEWLKANFRGPVINRYVLRWCLLDCSSNIRRLSAFSSITNNYEILLSAVEKRIENETQNDRRLLAEINYIIYSIITSTSSRLHIVAMACAILFRTAGKNCFSRSEQSAACNALDNFPSHTFDRRRRDERSAMRM